MNAKMPKPGVLDAATERRRAEVLYQCCRALDEENAELKERVRELEQRSARG